MGADHFSWDSPRSLAPPTQNLLFYFILFIFVAPPAALPQYCSVCSVICLHPMTYITFKQVFLSAQKKKLCLNFQTGPGVIAMVYMPISICSHTSGDLENRGSGGKIITATHNVYGPQKGSALALTRELLPQKHNNRVWIKWDPDVNTSYIEVSLLQSRLCWQHSKRGLQILDRLTIHCHKEG